MTDGSSDRQTRRRKTGWLLLAAVIAVPLVALGVPIYLWWTYFCFEEWRYLTEKELCEKAFATGVADKAIIATSVC